MQLNRAEFDGLSDEARIKYEGFRPGLYVRVQINDMPAEFVDNFEPTYPVILGGLLSAEQNVGYVTVGRTLPNLGYMIFLTELLSLTVY